MRKVKFRSRVRNADGFAAKLWEGWTDDEFNYYKSGVMWRAIVPEVGLQIAWGDTLKEAQVNAQRERDSIEKYKSTKTWAHMVEKWNRILNETYQNEQEAAK